MAIFDGFSDDGVQRIKNAGTFVTLPANWSPIWEKTPSDKAYILLSGEVSVRKDGEEIARLGPGEIIGEVIIVVLSVIVHVTFWTTLVFFVLERTGADTGARWSVDQLPEQVQQGTGRADLIASLVMLALFAGAVLWDQLRGWTPSDGAPLSILNPGLWPWGIGALMVLLAAEAALALAVFARGHWTMTLAWINAAVAVCVMSLGLTALGLGALFNPRFVEEVFLANGVGQDAVTVLAVLSGLAIIAIAVGDMADGWRKAARVSPS